MSGKEINAKHLPNISPRFVTFEVSHFDISGKDINDTQSQKITIHTINFRSIPF